MSKTYNIDAVHPILKRVVKSNLKGIELIKLYKKLEEVGYEGENIKLTMTRTMRELGYADVVCKEEPVILKEIISENLSMTIMELTGKKYDNIVDLWWGYFTILEGKRKLDFKMPINEYEFKVGETYKITFTKI